MCCNLVWYGRFWRRRLVRHTRHVLCPSNTELPREDPITRVVSMALLLDRGMHLEARMIRYAIALLSLVSLLPLHATTLAKASLDELIQKSTGIVRGRVAGSYTVRRGSLNYTLVRVKVLERWKGPEQATIEVTLPGGVVSGVRQTIAGVPELTEGAEYIFFLWTGRNQLTQLLGLSQGVLDITRDTQGIKLSRSRVDAMLVDPATGAQVEDDPVSVRLSEFDQRVRRVLSSEEK